MPDSFLDIAQTPTGRRRPRRGPVRRRGGRRRQRSAGRLRRQFPVRDRDRVLVPDHRQRADPARPAGRVRALRALARRPRPGQRAGPAKSCATACPCTGRFWGRARYDWEFADLAMAEMQRLGITPILDLMHFGVPDWLGNFQNPELPRHFADYAGAVADRYPWVRYYTPVNEIYVTARASAKDGLWNEQLKTDRGFVTALKHTAAASILATHAIARRCPNAVIVQSESAEYTHEARGRARPARYAWKTSCACCRSICCMPTRPTPTLYCYSAGQRHDPRGIRLVHGGRAARLSGHGQRLLRAQREDLAARRQSVSGRGCGGLVPDHAAVLRALPEARHAHRDQHAGRRPAAPTWLWKQWVNILRMREDGVPVLGFTWYSLIDQIDWDIELAEKSGTVNPCGLYDLDRRPARGRRLPAAAGRVRPDHYRSARRDIHPYRPAGPPQGRGVSVFPSKGNSRTPPSVDRDRQDRRPSKGTTRHGTISG